MTWCEGRKRLRREEKTREGKQRKKKRKEDAGGGKRRGTKKDARKMKSDKCKSKKFLVYFS